LPGEKRTLKQPSVSAVAKSSMQGRKKRRSSLSSLKSGRCAAAQKKGLYLRGRGSYLIAGIKIRWKVRPGVSGEGLS